MTKKHIKTEDRMPKHNAMFAYGFIVIIIAVCFILGFFWKNNLKNSSNQELSHGAAKLMEPTNIVPIRPGKADLAVASFNITNYESLCHYNHKYIQYDYNILNIGGKDVPKVELVIAINKIGSTTRQTPFSAMQFPDPGGSFLAGDSYSSFVAGPLDPGDYQIKITASPMNYINTIGTGGSGYYSYYVVDRSLDVNSINNSMIKNFTVTCP